MKRITQKARYSFRLQLFLHRLPNHFLLSCLFIISIVAFSAQCFAQEKWNATLRTGINFPTQKLGDTRLKTGFGFEGTIGYRVIPHLYANAGWAWNRLAADNESSNDCEETGYLVGLQFMHPVGVSKLSYLAGFNATYKHIETENDDGDLIADTGHGWGWQAETGLGFQLGKRTKLITFLRYSALSGDLEHGSEQTPLDLSYITAGAGFSWSF